MSSLGFAACSDYDLSHGNAKPRRDADSGTPDEHHDPAPDIAVTPAAIRYGVVENGQEKAEIARVTNEGDADLTVTGVSLPLGGDRGYTTSWAKSMPWTLAPGAGEDVTVTFSPLDPGSALGTLRVESDDPDEPAVDVPLDSTGDGCYDPDSAYDKHPAAGLVAVDASSVITATYDGSDAGYTSELWLTGSPSVYIATGHTSSAGTSVDLGAFAVGTELVFAIRVTDEDLWYYSGPAKRNRDGVLHAAVTYQGACKWTVGFEDSWGGGDQDFNDITMTIDGALEMQIVN